MPPEPKHPSTRARRNRTSTARTLKPQKGRSKKRALPDGQWHSMTVAWWSDLWSSPMAPEYDDSDIHGLYSLARLVDDFWQADSASQRAMLSSEIRLQRQCFGLTPIDRRRLQWEIERTDEAQAKGEKRRSTSDEPPEQPAAGGEDPRQHLRAV